FNGYAEVVMEISVIPLRPALGHLVDLTARRHMPVHQLANILQRQATEVVPHPGPRHFLPFDVPGHTPVAHGALVERQEHGTLQRRHGPSCPRPGPAVPAHAPW